MERKKRRKRNITLVVLFGIIVAWQYGLFNRYTYLTAKVAIIRDAPMIVVVGDLTPCGAECIELREKYGFTVKNFGTKATKSQLRGIEDYNFEIEAHLDRKNGEGWKERYEAELAEIKNNKP